MKTDKFIVLLEDGAEILAAFTDKIKAKNYGDKHNKKFGTNFKCSGYLELDPEFSEES